MKISKYGEFLGNAQAIGLPIYLVLVETIKHSSNSFDELENETKIVKKNIYEV